MTDAARNVGVSFVVVVVKFCRFIITNGFVLLRGISQFVRMNWFGFSFLFLLFSFLLWGFLVRSQVCVCASVYVCVCARANVFVCVCVYARGGVNKNKTKTAHPDNITYGPTTSTRAGFRFTRHPEQVTVTQPGPQSGEEETLTENLSRAASEVRSPDPAIP